MHNISNIFSLIMHHKENILILKNSLKYLRRHLVWPAKTTELNPGRWFYIKFALLSLSTSLLGFGPVNHLVRGIIENDLFNIDKDLPIIISLIGTYYFNYQYIKKVPNTAQAYRALSDFTTFGKPKNFTEDNKKLNMYSFMHMVYITMAGLAFTLAPMFEAGRCRELNKQFNKTEPCGLVASVPFEVEIFPRKQLAFGIHVYSAWFSYITSSFISFSIMESVQHVILRLRHVGECFVEALSQNDVRKRRDEFNKCIRYHNAVISLAEQLDESFDGCMFLHVLLTGAILGFVGYSLLATASLSAVALFIGWFVSLVFVCSVGQLLIHESMKIGETIYFTNWHELNVDIQKDLVLVLLRCNKPIYLHSGPFGYMSYATIIVILKTSYSYLTLMKQTK